MFSVLDYRRKKMAKDKCTLTDAELIEKAHDWISRLAKTGGREWCLRAKFLASVFDDD